MEYLSNLSEEEINKLSDFIAHRGFDMLLEYFEEYKLRQLQGLISVPREKLTEARDIVDSCFAVIGQLKVFRDEVKSKKDKTKRIKKI